MQHREGKAVTSAARAAPVRRAKATVGTKSPVTPRASAWKAAPQLSPHAGKAWSQRPSTARTVGSFVARLTRPAFEKFGFSAATLITDWGTIVGADIARYTSPQRLKWPRRVRLFG